jgi:hypothetical protein
MCVVIQIEYERWSIDSIQAGAHTPPTSSAMALVELKMAEEEPWNNPHAAAHRSRKSYTAADRSV